MTIFTIRSNHLTFYQTTTQLDRICQLTCTLCTGSGLMMSSRKVNDINNTLPVSRLSQFLVDMRHISTCLQRSRTRHATSQHMSTAIEDTTCDISAHVYSDRGHNMQHISTCLQRSRTRHGAYQHMSTAIGNTNCDISAHVYRLQRPRTRHATYQHMSTAIEDTTCTYQHMSTAIEDT